MQVEVVYGSAERQSLISLQVPKNTTVAVAIEQSGILREYSHLRLNELKVGIFSKKTDLQHVLKAGDRVEIYRPLLIDPKEARRSRV